MATILIVDDHVLNREILIMALDYAEHRVLEASDGEQALKLVGSERPDLVITDILMPKMDGYEFVSRLRADPAIAATPVIFYTATYRETEAKVMALACGVRWTLAKPSDPDVIARTVQEALGEPMVSLSDSENDPADFETGRFFGLENQLTASSRDLKTNLDNLDAKIAEGGARTPEYNEIKAMVQKLSDSMSSLQAMSLRLTTLIELGIELASERDPARLVVAGSRLAQNICVAKYAVVGLIGEQQDQYEYLATSGLDSQAEAKLVGMSSRSGVLARLVDGNVPLRQNEVGGDASVLGLPDGHPPIHSFLGAPITTRERNYGWIYLGDKIGADGFSEFDERIAATVADQLAVAYENLIFENEAQQSRLKMARDLSENIRQNEDLRRFRAAMDHSSDAVMVIDRDAGIIVDINPAGCALLGHEREVLQKVSAEQALEERERFGELGETLAALVDPEGPTELELTRAESGTLRIELSRKSYRSPDGWMIVLIARESTRRAKSSKR